MAGLQTEAPEGIQSAGKQREVREEAAAAGGERVEKHNVMEHCVSVREPPRASTTLL